MKFIFLLYLQTWKEETPRYCTKKCVKFKNFGFLYLKSNLPKKYTFYNSKISEILLTIALEKDGYCQFFKLSSKEKSLN